MARQAGARSIVGHALNNRGAARVHLGEVDAGLADLDQAREIAEELLDDVDDVLRAIVNRCTALFDVGRLAEAADLALEGVAVARRLGLERRKGVWGRCDAAEALLAVGRIGEAGDLVEEAVAFEPAGIDRVRVLVVSGRLALVRGRLAEAEAALVEGADVGAAVTDEQLVGPIATAMVHLHLAQGDPVAGLEAAEAGWARLPVHDPAFATPLATAALEAAVDATLAGNGSMASADRWLARCRQVARGSSLPLVQAWVATAGAQRTRLDSIPSPRAWESSAAAWDTLGAPLAAAHDRWRQAEALVASGGSRDVARAVARWAEETCRQRGAIGLAAQVRDFVRRARLDAPSGGPDGHGLTPRERDVLRLVADGLTNREIGDRLFIGHRTVATHVSNLLGKLSAASRSEAAVIAVRDGLLN